MDKVQTDNFCSTNNTFNKSLKVIGSFYSMNNLKKENIKLNSFHQFERKEHLRSNLDFNGFDNLKKNNNISYSFKNNPNENNIYINNKKEFNRNTTLDYSNNRYKIFTEKNS